jgi:hypothetical protein
MVDHRPNSVATMMGCRDLQCSAVRKDTKQFPRYWAPCDNYRRLEGEKKEIISPVGTVLYRVPWIIWSVNHEGEKSDNKVSVRIEEFSSLHRTTASKYNRQCLRFGWEGWISIAYRPEPPLANKHWNSVHYASMRSCHTRQWYSTVQYSMGPFWKQLIMPT